MMSNILKINEIVKNYAGWILVIFHAVGLFLLGGEWRDELDTSPRLIYCCSRVYFF